jgi:hypothetical protein
MKRGWRRPTSPPHSYARVIRWFLMLQVYASFASAPGLVSVGLRYEVRSLPPKKPTCNVKQFRSTGECAHFYCCNLKYWYLLMQGLIHVGFVWSQASVVLQQGLVATLVGVLGAGYHSCDERLVRPKRAYFDTSRLTWSWETCNRFAVGLIQYIIRHEQCMCPR